MSDITLQRILAALERIERQLERRPVTYTPSPQPAPAWQPPPGRPVPYYEPRWVDGLPYPPTSGRPFDPFLAT